MKKTAGITIGVFLFLVSVYTGSRAATVALTESNELPNGPAYATVELEAADEQCVLMSVSVNQDELQSEQAGFGIQRFGFNYPGEDELEIEFDDDDDGNWNITVNGSESFGPFGTYTYDLAGDGNSRQNPLEIIVCGDDEDLSVDDFIYPNEDYYYFSVHIAGFDELPGSDGENVTSAYFAAPEEPTLIELAMFIAVPGVNKVRLFWGTDDETDNAGFNIYRADAEAGEYARINTDMIPAQGTSSTYSFVDEQAGDMKTYYYKLEDVDVYGNSTLHGPVNATPSIIYLLLDLFFELF